MKKIIFFPICFFCLLFNCCYKEENWVARIKVDNQTSQDVHVSVYPKKIIHGEVTYNYMDIAVKSENYAILIVEFSNKKYLWGPTPGIAYGPDPNNDIEAIIFSKFDTKELIKKVELKDYKKNEDLFQFDHSFKYFYILEITDVLLSTEGEEE